MPAEFAIPWDVIFKYLMDYGILGIMAGLFLRAVMVQFSTLTKLAVSSNVSLAEAVKKRDEIIERDMISMRESMNNHNQRTLECLSDIENLIEKVDTSVTDEKVECRALIRELSSYVDEVRSVTAEIKYVCPSRQRRQIGDILIENGFVTPENLAAAVKIQEGINKN